ncbi:hypothetical protein [Mycobacterium shimoidei]|uniref:hypothetical protein n=1 Tax=Mycobacterium shimoidei TaxID=29313 RepID=UPI00111C3405|nr:hypothetical protein [Mycobacterium shimoidei]MCV7258839.1 hypothetical protein [Mycobacterium shimoidei]
MKWALLGVTLIAVIAITVAATLYFTRGDSGSGSQAPPSPSAAGIASASDKGPVAIITDDSSCAPWTPIQNTIAAAESNGGWDQRDYKIPASAWTPELRAQYESVAKAMRNAADQTVAVARLTPHRVMRELYEQSIAYWRAYADRIPNYTASDDELAVVVKSTTGALGAICAAIGNGSAAARGPIVSPAAPPAQIAPLGDLTNPSRFLPASNQICGDWKATALEYEANTAIANWRNVDPNIPAGQWTQEQKAAADAVAPVMNALADKTEQMGRRSGNPIWEDFAGLAAQYRRGFVLALPTYTAADSWLENAATNVYAAVFRACAAVGG